MTTTDRSPTPSAAADAAGTGAPGSVAVVDLGAIAANVASIRSGVGAAEVMAVVKADGYGHGAVPAARAAIAGGASWLGVAFVGEALGLRAAGVDVPILTLIATAGDDLATAVAAGVDLSVGHPSTLWAVAAAAGVAGRAARVHLEFDSGLTRGGTAAAGWPELVRAAAEASGIEIVAIWSHFACADEPGHPANAQQLAAYRDALATARRLSVDPPLRHLANSAATLTMPASHFDLVRPGIAVFGVPPGPKLSTEHLAGLRPAMTLRSRLAAVKRVPAGAGLSYGHTRTTVSATTVGLVPLGYADGIPWHASNRGQVLVGGARRPVVGRVCMDQFLVDAGDDAALAVGDEVVVFGTGAAGEPTAADWAAATGTISYEILTGIGARVPRSYIGAAEAA